VLCGTLVLNINKNVLNHTQKMPHAKKLLDEYQSWMNIVVRFDIYNIIDFIVLITLCLLSHGGASV